MFLPEGYDEYILCTEIYHCTPSELDQQPSLTAKRDLAIWNGVQTAVRQKQQAAKQQR